MLFLLLFKRQEIERIRRSPPLLIATLNTVKGFSRKIAIDSISGDNLNLKIGPCAQGFPWSKSFTAWRYLLGTRAVEKIRITESLPDLDVTLPWKLLVKLEVSSTQQRPSAVPTMLEWLKVSTINLATFTWSKLQVCPCNPRYAYHSFNKSFFTNSQEGEAAPREEELGELELEALEACGTQRSKPEYAWEGNGVPRRRPCGWTEHHFNDSWVYAMYALALIACGWKLWLSDM